MQLILKSDSAPRGWFHVLGELEDGSRMDILSREPVSGTKLSKPERFASTYRNHNERRFWHLAVSNDWPQLRALLARNLCRSWNEREPMRLVQVGIIHAHTVLGKEDEPILRTLIIHQCEHSTQGED